MSLLVKYYLNKYSSVYINIKLILLLHVIVSVIYIHTTIFIKTKIIVKDLIRKHTHTHNWNVLTNKINCKWLDSGFESFSQSVAKVKSYKLSKFG